MDAGAAAGGLDGLLSEARLTPYLERCHGDRTYALRLYTWNLAVSSALWGPISVLEVAVRNAIHDQLVERAGRGDWWSDTRIKLCDRERDAIDSTIATLERRGTPDPSSDQVVAATSFGLWVGLTSAGTPRDPVFSYETALWQPRLQRAFPHRGSHGRRYIHAKLDDIRLLRNRIAHHEPIHRSPLQARYDDILEVTAMIDPAGRDYIATHSRAQDVISQENDAMSTGEIRF